MPANAAARRFHCLTTGRCLQRLWGRAAASRPADCGGSLCVGARLLLLLRTRPQRIEILLAAQRHDCDFAGAERWDHHLRDAVAFEERDVSWLGAARGKI